jgi:phage antirepressor YoqD-like protein
LLSRRIETLPLRALVKLQEVAALLEAGERLDTFLAREKVGKRRGKVQVQQREDVDRGMRTEAETSVENAALEGEARAAIGAAVVAHRRRFRA